MGDVILVSSQKNNIGKTIISIKTGVELSKTKKIVLLDLSAGKKKIAEYLGVDEDIIYDIKDVLDGICSDEQAVLEIKENLNLLPSPRIAGKLGDIKGREFKRIILDLKNKYDAVIVDADGISSRHYIGQGLIDTIISVNDNDFSCVREIIDDFSVAEKLGASGFIAAINRYNKKKAVKGTMLRLKDIERMLEIKLSPVIEEDQRYENITAEFLLKDSSGDFEKAVLSVADWLNKK
jgi:septum site-determining protein MinD